MSSSSLLFFFFYASAPLRHLHSFPTRRSSDLDVPLHVTVVGGVAVDDDRLGAARLGFLHFEAAEHLAIAHDDDTPLHRQRSEEHTSELQSHHDLVCRLLLEKKKKNNTNHQYYK